MQTNDYMPILKKTGGALMVIGLIDICVMIYCIANDISYSSSFNIFAVIAGILLFRGGLRTASAVRWYSTFMLSVAISLIVAWPFMQPLSLSLAQIRLNPGISIFALVAVPLMLWFLRWLSKELGRQPVLAAMTTAGVKIGSARTATVFGIGLVILLAAISSFTSRGETAERAKAIAMQQVGSGYSFYVGSMHTSNSSHGSSASVVVTAWNDREIKTIPVHWDER